jgi:hypothetical protein
MGIASSAMVLATQAIDAGDRPELVLFSTEAQAAAALVAIIGGYRLVGLSVEHRDSSGRSTSFDPISARPFRG